MASDDDMFSLRARPLTAEDFSPFGEVIAAAAGTGSPMNSARFERFGDLAAVDVDGSDAGGAVISIVRSRRATRLPYVFDTVERHPLGSQAFVPLAPFRFLVVVAPPGESVERDDLCAFVSEGQQGVSYRRNVWHMPLIALSAKQSFLVVDRADVEGNCEEYVLDGPVRLLS